MTSDRDSWFDCLRGLGIFLVVVGHTLRGLDASGLIAPELIAFFDPRLYAVHVQILFFVSGALVFRSLQQHGARRFAFSRISALFVPMVIWTYVFLGIKFLAGENQNNAIGISSFLIWPVPGYAHLWFLWALFLMHLAIAALWIWRPSNVQITRGLSLLFLLISLMLMYLPLQPEVFRWIGHTQKYLPFFFLGFAFAEWGCARMLQGPLSWLAALVFMALFLVAPWLQVSQESKLVVSILLCLSLFGAGEVVMQWAPLKALLVKLGTGAMAIYVLHTIFSAGFRECLNMLGMQSMTFYILIGVAGGIWLPLLVRDLARHLRIARRLGI